MVLPDVDIWLKFPLTLGKESLIETSLNLPSARRLTYLVRLDYIRIRMPSYEEDYEDGLQKMTWRRAQAEPPDDNFPRDKYNRPAPARLCFEAKGPHCCSHGLHSSKVQGLAALSPPRLQALDYLVSNGAGVIFVLRPNGLALPGDPSTEQSKLLKQSTTRCSYWELPKNSLSNEIGKFTWRLCTRVVRSFRFSLPFLNSGVFVVLKVFFTQLTNKER